MSEESELEKRIRELEAENSRLKSKASRACYHKVEEFLHRHGNNSALRTPTANHSNDEKI